MSYTKQKIKIIIITAVVTSVLLSAVFIFLTPFGEYMALRNIIKKSYVENVDDKKLDEYAFSGMVVALDDPYSNYFTKEQYKSFVSGMSSQYEGIGIMIQADTQTDTCKITRVFDGSPSQKAGIMKGDILKSVDGETVTTKNYEHIVSLLRGEIEKEKKEYEIELIRDDKTFTVRVKRDVIEKTTVFYKNLDGTAYVEITNFDEPTAEEFKNVLDKIKKDGLKSMIIDLRDNPGGYMETALDIADSLLPKCNLVSLKDRAGKEVVYKSDDKFTDVGKIAIIMNGQSASASEVLIGALCDNKKAVTVGEKSFGKGCVQNLIKLPRGAALKLTTAYYYSPNGKCIHDIGFNPDYPAKNESDYDLQLDTALKILQKTK